MSIVGATAVEFDALTSFLCDSCDSIRGKEGGSAVTVSFQFGTFFCDPEELCDLTALK